MRYITLLILGAILGCSSHIANEATVTVDYFGVRESTRGPGWDNPLNVERLYLAEVKPIVVLYASVDDKESKKLITEIIMKGWKPKVWVLDRQNPVTQLLQVLMSANVSKRPTLVYESKSVSLVIVGKDNIQRFFKQHSFALLDIKGSHYY